MDQKILESGSAYYFKQFTRRAYAVFNSLKITVHISTLTLVSTLIAAPTNSIAQSDKDTISKTLDLEEVEILGQLSPSVFEELSRMVSIVPQVELEHAPGQSITDILNFSAPIDIRERGRAGVQADISIRGGSHDQNLVLLNGINISDPQTGHLSLFLPVEREAVKRIEILNGAAARVHGSNAFSGAINFIAEPDTANSLTLSSTGGEYEFLRNTATLNLSLGKSTNLLHYYNANSGGYTRNTDFFRQGFYYHGILHGDAETINVQFGFADRSFGSNSFYTPRYPDQFEDNQMSLFALGYETGKNTKLKTQVYWRRHRDRWEMFRVDPEWYRIENGSSVSNDTSRTTFDTTFVYTNHHLNDVYGAKLMLSRRTGLGVTTLGWHLRSENILSTNIGFDRGIVAPVRGYNDISYTKSDSRTLFDLHAEQTLSFYNLYASGGVLVNWNSYTPDQLNLFPGIDVMFSLHRLLRLVGSYNYTLGLPSFTDLTYEDPNNTGNNSLKPYTQHSLEGGIKLVSPVVYAGGVIFQNWGKDVIDWIWFEDQNSFQPRNIPNYKALGAEISGQLNVPQEMFLSHLISSARVSFTFIDMQKDIPGNIQKYFHLRRKFALMMQSKPTDAIIISTNIKYNNRSGSYLGYNFGEGMYETNAFQPFWLVDIGVSYTWRNLTFHIEATNVLDTQYIDIGSIYQPGRWISGGVEFSFTKF